MARSTKKSVPSKTGEISSDGKQCSGCSEGNCPIHHPSASEQATSRRIDPEIGKATQFKPGQSGNPGGKPKSKPITEMLQKLFDEQGLTIYETMMGVFTGKSAVAKVMLLEKAAERLEGKVVQPVEGDINLNLGISDRLLRAKERLENE